MKKEKSIYMVIESSPDGDNYQIHSSLKEARTSFSSESEKSIILGESTFYLVEVKDQRNFGFGARGDFYGGEIIESFAHEE